MYKSQFAEKNGALFIASGLCLFLMAFLYYPVFRSLVQDWIHLPDFSYGFIIPVISAYFVWKKKEELQKTEISPRSSGLIIILLGLCLLTLGRMASESFTMRFSFLVAIAGTIIFLLGYRHLRILSFPLVFLIFMIPIPSIIMGKITFPLQLFASSFAARSLDVLGIPVLREGNVIHLANCSLEVAEACSGIRSLVSLLALGTVFAYIAQKGIIARSFLILSCIPIAIFMDALRVTATGILADRFGSSVAGGVVHSFFGFLLFFCAILLLLALNFAVNFFRDRAKR